MQTTKTLRLDKALCDMGYGTRSEVKKMIAQGRIAIDGQVVRSADRKVDLTQPWFATICTNIVCCISLPA